MVRLLGGRRTWEHGLEALRASGVPVVALGGEATPDAELGKVLSQRKGVIQELDSVKNDEPYLIRQLIGSKLRDQKVVSGAYKHVDGT